MSKKYRIFRGISITLSLVALIAIFDSMFGEHSDHNYPLVIGLGLVAIANVLNHLANS